MTTGTLQAEQRAGLTQQRRYKVIDTGPGFTWQRAVSYTHLTLPTIYSV